MELARLALNGLYRVMSMPLLLGLLILWLGFFIVKPLLAGSIIALVVIFVATIVNFAY
jgi:hypothetical protein